MYTIEEKYGKLNKKVRDKIKHFILSKMKRTTELNVHYIYRNARNIMKAY